jgi:hypothetical protein
MGYRTGTILTVYIVPYLSILVQPQGDKELKREVGAFDIHRGVGANLAGASILDPERFDTDPASMLPHYGSGYFFSVAFWMATKIKNFSDFLAFCLLLTHCRYINISLQT